MTDEQKIKLADLIISFLSENTTTTEYPRMIGTLTKSVGIKGFKKAEAGIPVFEFKDRYIIYLVRDDGNQTVEVSYYKNTLNPIINFIK